MRAMRSLKQTIFTVLIGWLIIIGTIVSFFLPSSALAQDRTVNSGGSTCPDGYIKLSVPLQDGSDCVLESDETTELKDNSIIVYTRNIVRFLSAGVGIVIVLMIIIGGIQYITSQGNPQATASAKNRITNAIIALFLFIFMAAILNFLIPGGLL